MLNHIKNKDHNLEHNVLYYDKRNSNYNEHLIEFDTYCSLCNLKLCKKCEKDHDIHKNKIILYKREKLENKKKREIKLEIKNNKNKPQKRSRIISSNDKFF